MGFLGSVDKWMKPGFTKWESNGRAVREKKKGTEQLKGFGVGEDDRGVCAATTHRRRESGSSSGDHGDCAVGYECCAKLMI
ncbi:hypothetical protein LR48_Vigan05g144700 [Vigna angularis]|uniref:Uncharacterized protein n=1 Tax=Phaseolus angularis TaxID=3914 RepID=A0A0L9UMN3_PHAAN|nr:hypothetical protein LR48_Vigan05g144700 [Vigna angularis]